MSPGEGHLTGEAEIVANKYLGAAANRGGEGFIVRVSDADNVSGFLLVLVWIRYLDQSEVAQAVIGESVGAVHDATSCAFNRAFDQVEKGVVGERVPASRDFGRIDKIHLLAGNGVGSAVEHEIIFVHSFLSGLRMNGFETELAWTCSQ